MSKVKQFIDIFRLYFSGHVGDAAVLKLDLFGMQPSEDCARRIAGMGARVSRFDIQELRRMPEGTLGREFATFCDRHKITPIDISPDVRDKLSGKDFAIRYMTVHDLIHTILGFDATQVGEIGVYAFTVEQGYFRGGQEWLRVAKMVYSAITPWRIGAVQRAIERGRELGRRAAYLISEPLEEQLARPLAEVRRAYGIS